MPFITASFDLILSSHVRLQFPSRSASFQFRIMDYCVKAEMPEDGNCGSMHPEKQPPIVLSNRLTLLVSRDEEQMPDIKALVQGRNMSARGQWFGPKYSAFREIAVDAAHRIIHYFKHSLLTPGLRYFTGHETTFFEPTWLDDKGASIETGMHSFGLGIGPTEPGPKLLGQGTLQDSGISTLTAALEAEPKEISSAREFLSDAQTSIAEGNFPRSVLELAIAC